MQQRASQLPAPLVVTTPSLAPGDPGAYTLDSLRQRLGLAERPRVLAYVALAPVATLVEEGGRVSTERLVREGTRIFGLALDVVSTADADRRVLLPALDEPMITAAVTALVTCDALSSSRVEAADKSAAQGTKRRSTRASLVGKVTAARKLTYAAALSLAAGDPDRRKQLDDAWGSGDDPEHLASSLTKLVTITRSVVAGARARGVSVSLQDAWLDAQDSLARELTRAVENADAAVADGPVGQGEVAWWRGVVLWFVRQMVDTIDAARASDPRIRKIPLGDLQKVLRRSAKSRRKTPAQPPAPPAPPA